MWAKQWATPGLRAGRARAARPPPTNRPPPPCPPPLSPETLVRAAGTAAARLSPGQTPGHLTPKVKVKVNLTFQVRGKVTARFKDSRTIKVRRHTRAASVKVRTRGNSINAWGPPGKCSKVKVSGIYQVRELLPVKVREGSFPCQLSRHRGFLLHHRRRCHPHL
jgi:hypothetical protein